MLVRRWSRLPVPAKAGEGAEMEGAMTGFPNNQTQFTKVIEGFDLMEKAKDTEGPVQLILDTVRMEFERLSRKLADDNGIAEADLASAKSAILEEISVAELIDDLRVTGEANPLTVEAFWMPDYSGDPRICIFVHDEVVDFDLRQIPVDALDNRGREPGIDNVAYFSALGRNLIEMGEACLKMAGSLSGDDSNSVSH